MENGRVKIEELAFYVDSSTQTINTWYAWKKLHPEHKLAQLLPSPEYIQKGGKKVRYWNQSDIGRVIEFKKSIPHGRNGILGEITNRNYRGKESKNGKKDVCNKRNIG